MRPKIPNFFLVGSQKSATTWIYRCLVEHPQIYLPANDEIHFFDIHYFRGVTWYQKFYNGYKGEKIAGDTTSSYIRDPQVPKRIANYNSDAKLIFSLRNPIDRAFSHYWHEKRKGKIAFDFSEIFENYDLFQNFIVPGFYHYHLENFYAHFPQNQILLMIYEDLEKDPRQFLQKILTFLNVNTDFLPKVLYNRINKALYMPSTFEKAEYHFYFILSRTVMNLLPWKIKERLQQRYPFDLNSNGIQSEYDRGMDNALRADIRKIFKFENEKLGKLINRDLSFWS